MLHVGDGFSPQVHGQHLWVNGLRTTRRPTPRPHVASNVPPPIDNREVKYVVGIKGIEDSHTTMVTNTNDDLNARTSNEFNDFRTLSTLAANTTDAGSDDFSSYHSIIHTTNTTNTNASTTLLDSSRYNSRIIPVIDGYKSATSAAATSVSSLLFLLPLRIGLMK